MHLCHAGRRQRDYIQWHHSSYIQANSFLGFLALCCRVYDRFDTWCDTLYMCRPSEPPTAKNCHNTIDTNVLEKWSWGCFVSVFGVTYLAEADHGVAIAMEPLRVRSVKSPTPTDPPHVSLTLILFVCIFIYITYMYYFYLWVLCIIIIWYCYMYIYSFIYLFIESRGLASFLC